jgi:spore germination cell wall hydrolase CwlJ-like protein
VLEERVREGRFTQEQVEATRAEGRRVAAALDAGRRWWSAEWASWEPDPSWPKPTLPPDSTA